MLSFSSTLKPRAHRALLSGLLVLIAAISAPAANLHFILFVETLDPNIGGDQDMNHATAWARTIASYTGLTLQLKTLSGSQLTTSNARNMLLTLNPGPDDVVFFLYSGHGANLGGEWPVFTFIAPSSAGPLPFNEVASTLQTKPGRMLVVMADCCNVVIDSSTQLIPPFEPSGQTALTATNCCRLFLNFRGTILATAATRGQYSLGSRNQGGLFWSTFMDDFSTLADMSPDLTWDEVLAKTAADAKDLGTYYITQGNMGIAPQEAYYSIMLEQVAASTPDQPAGNDNGSDPSPSDSSSPSNTSQSSSGCGAMSPLPMMLSIMFGLCVIRVRRR